MARTYINAMDIDFTTTIGTNFSLGISDGGQAVTGNRKLVNRFEITFLTAPAALMFQGSYEADDFGGNAITRIGHPRVLNDLQAIAAGAQAAVEATVASIASDQDGMADTEKIDSASVTSLDVVDGIVRIGINIVPVETEAWSVLQLNLPITRYNNGVS